MSNLACEECFVIKRSFLTKLSNLKGYEFPVFLYLIANMGEDNVVFAHPKRMIETIMLSSSQIIRHLKMLNDQEIIKKVWPRQYVFKVNEDIFLTNLKGGN